MDLQSIIAQPFLKKYFFALCEKSIGMPRVCLCQKNGVISHACVPLSPSASSLFASAYTYPRLTFCKWKHIFTWSGHNCVKTCKCKENFKMNSLNVVSKSESKDDIHKILTGYSIRQKKMFCGQQQEDCSIDLL